jgi:anaerobic magnesium-protoporphyrin IX monomethyl ester cyclase
VPKHCRGQQGSAHTFRGSTIRSFLGLEDERKAFQRFQAIRRAERAYV